MLKVNNISFSYNETPVVSNVSLNAKKGEHIAVIGESGSGKTTLLKMLFGEFDLKEGEVIWNNQQILGPKYNLITGYDFMKFVTQEFDLMPYISVEDNIGKHLSRLFPEERQERINTLIKVVELEPFAKTKVQYLSGGQKQRVALARALAKQPEILLLDEPFSHIDNFKKQSLRRNLFSFLKEENITCIVATHDKEDALPFSDRIIVLHEGKMIANKTPQQLYTNPKLPLIASFFEEYSIINGSFLGLDDLDIIVYSNQLKIDDSSNLKVRVANSYFKGHYYLIEALLEEKIIYFNSTNAIDRDEIIGLKYLKQSSL